MSEKSVTELLDSSMKNLKQLVDVDTIIGDPIKPSEDVTIIPVSKVSFGFASGGSDFPSKARQDMFGGGSGGGVTIQPIAFLVITADGVKLLNVAGASGADKFVEMIPEVINKVSGVIKKNKENKNTESEA